MALFISVMTVFLDAGVIEILIEILHRLVIIRIGVNDWLLLLLAANNTLIILLVEEFDECIIWHVLPRLNKAFSLELDVGFLRHELLVEGLLSLDWSSHPVRI